MVGTEQRRVVRRVVDDHAGNADWFLDLLAEVEGDSTEWTDRLKEDKVEIIQPASARQNFSRLRKFYANMLGSAKPNDDNISAADLVNCWFIAGVDMDRLKASAWTNRESYLNHSLCLEMERFDSLLR